jgi:hypothetical protein
MDNTSIGIVSKVYIDREMCELLKINRWTK